MVLISEDKERREKMNNQDYEIYAKQVYYYLLSLTNNAMIAEELTQETFYQAMKSSSKFDGSYKITTWLCGIAKRVLYKYYRKHPVQEEFIDQYASKQSIHQDLLNKEMYQIVLKQIHLLNEPLKELMYLRLFSDLSFKEIGDVIGKSENWARVNFYRTKEKIKKELIKNEE